MNLRKGILLLVGLGMLAALMACSTSSSTKTTSPTITITASNTGYTSPQTVGNPFGTLSATVLSNGSPASGVSVTFTAPAAGANVATGTFATSPAGATDTETTNSSGVATSKTFTAGTVAGSYGVTATTSGATTPASFSLANNAGPAATIATSTPANGTETAMIGTAFAALSVLVTDSDGNPVAGQSVTFTVNPGGTGASAAFSGATPLTDTENTGANGMATTSQTLTANMTLGPFTVTASSGALTPATFNLSNNSGTSAVLPAGNYVFSVKGTDTGSAACGANCSSAYIAVGVFAVDNNGVIINGGGEMDFSDANYFTTDPIIGGSVALSPDSGKGDTNLIITIVTGDISLGPGSPTGKGNGTLVLNASMASNKRGQVAEYDTWASGSGELNLQNLPTPNTDLCPNAATTPCGYAFYADGPDHNGVSPMAMGGVLRVDGASGAISGTGSVFDINDACASVSGGNCVGGILSGQTLTVNQSKVSSPDSNGLVTFSLTCPVCPGGNYSFVFDGYMVNANLIRVVENWTADNSAGITGGTMVAQTGVGGFSTSSISGSSYVLRTGGGDKHGRLQASGVITFNPDLSVGGNLAFNDITGQSPQGGTAITGGTYSVDATGRVTVTGLTPFNYTLEFYLNGGTTGNAPVISMDATAANPDVLAGYSWQQSSGLSATSFSGNYALGAAQFVSSGGNEFEVNGDGVATGTNGTLSGYLDQNNSLAGGALTPDTALSGTYASTTTNGVVTVTGSGSNKYTIYLIDATQGVIIENDSGQLLSGFFANH